MKNIILTISLILLVGCKNIVKEQPVVEKPTVHLMEKTPSSVANKIKIKELDKPETDKLCCEPSVRPVPEIQPVASEIYVSPNSAMAMIIILALCGFGVFYFVIKNGKK